MRTTLDRCAVSHETRESGHDGHEFVRDESLPVWRDWYSFRHFYSTEINRASGSSETASRALGNSKEVFNKHYDGLKDVRADVHKAVVGAMAGLTA